MANRRDAVAALLGLPALCVGGCARSGKPAGGGAGPLAVRGSTATLEIAPVLLAARDHYPGRAIVRNGGIGNLVGAARVAGLGDEGPADVATHAETQALRYSVANPEIRIILTVTEGRYRIIARRSAGIASLTDLKGKRIATIATTSAGFFLARMLAQVRLDFTDIVPVRISPIEGMAEALARREVDAVAIWEPHGGNAALALGEDRVEFPGDGVYRELFNLNTTTANLADPDKRRRIVAFVRAIIDASQAIGRDSERARKLVAATAGFSLDEVARAWPTLTFPAALPPDLLDTLESEEQWLAAQEGRAVRPRAVLAGLIDPSVLAEARAR
ncbi:PhnD/SsuA/transferrin family substrate-binding protein [Sphingomonas suaedae]|uniref:PhnD/SsuA/transferrin family substrate-binding protein n=1 Tax=Sphingomonas suaedae TaxID=2599297 RepID=A0A518RJR0_9SPHN|nr:ABC transporter substrate-binding protein [Sphingomonas suaedae]QDX27685.1 PhnD/SsuA/transferrin family substrate-binding protein [Sphingomonas suaedae]